MANKTGFRNRGDQYLYIESAPGASLAVGADEGTGTFNINTSASNNVEPVEATSNFAIDPSANGDIVLQPNGSGANVFSAGDVHINAGNIDILTGNLLLAGVSGTDGQLLIGDSSGNAAWASLTSSDGSVSFSAGANSLDLTVAGGAAADNFPTDSGTAVPSSGFLNILGGSNIDTSASGNTVTVALENDVTISGDYETTGGNIHLPTTNSSFTEGVITINGDRFFYSASDNNSVYIGADSGNTSAVSAYANVAVGFEALLKITNGSKNLALGHRALDACSSGRGNVAAGVASLGNLTTGFNNACLGIGSGSSITSGARNVCLLGGDTSVGSGSNNVYISNGGASESNTIRIGTEGSGQREQNRAFMAGIYQKTPSAGSNIELVVQDSSGELGSTADPSVDSVTASGDIETTGGNVVLPSTTSSQGQVTIGGNNGIHTFGTNNFFAGANAGNFTLSNTGNIGTGRNNLNSLSSGSNNASYGELTMESISSGSGNVGIGPNVMRNLTTSDHNTSVGSAAGSQIVDGEKNTFYGWNTGTSGGGSDSHNVYIRNAGTSESNTIRIGTQGSGTGQQDTAFMAGIYNVTPSGGQDGTVVINSNGQLGSTLAPEVNSISFDSGSNALSNFTDKTAFTPIVEFGGASTGITYATQYGEYSRVGDAVFYNLRVTFSNKGSATGGAVIKTPGVPQPSTQGSAITIRATLLTFTSGEFIQGAHSASSDSIVLSHLDGTTGSETFLDDTNFSNNTSIFIMGMHFV